MRLSEAFIVNTICEIGWRLKFGELPQASQEDVVAIARTIMQRAERVTTGEQAGGFGDGHPLTQPIVPGGHTIMETTAVPRGGPSEPHPTFYVKHDDGTYHEMMPPSEYELALIERQKAMDRWAANPEALSSFRGKRSSPESVPALAERGGGPLTDAECDTMWRRLLVTLDEVGLSWMEGQTWRNFIRTIAVGLFSPEFVPQVRQADNDVGASKGGSSGLQPPLVSPAPPPSERLREAAKGLVADWRSAALIRYQNARASERDHTYELERVKAYQLDACADQLNAALQEDGKP